jgi:hypothetical protein
MNPEGRSGIYSKPELSNELFEETAKNLCSFSVQTYDHIKKVAYLSREEEYNLVRKEIASRLYRSTVSSQNEAAASWRKRCQRQTAIDNELTKLGPLALLCSGGLLVAYRDHTVERVHRHSRWKPTLLESPIFDLLDRYGKAHLLTCAYEPYVRLELAIQAFGQMICLATSDLTDRELIAGFCDFKVWCINQAFKDEEALDHVILYIKWLAKAAQSVFLKSQVPDEPELRPERTNGMILPYVGKLKFVSNYIQSGRRRELLSSAEARSLAQLANTNRALPYPSTRQICQSVEDTVSIFTSDFSVEVPALKVHRLGMNSIRSSLGVSAGKKTHSSLVSKGTVELPRSKGGRSAFLVASARMTTDLDLVDGFKVLVNQRDQFGNIIIDPTTWELAFSLLSNREYKHRATLGDILYLQPEELEEQWEYSLNQGKRIPLHLAQILNNIASKLVLSLGSYSHPHKIICGLLTFGQKVESVRFKLERIIPVKADVSIEAGLKARLTTSQMAAVAHLAQLPSNTMRSYLSQDPFCRVGFEESEKLWEVLKQYGKEFK